MHTRPTLGLFKITTAKKHLQSQRQRRLRFKIGGAGKQNLRCHLEKDPAVMNISSKPNRGKIERIPPVRLPVKANPGRLGELIATTEWMRKHQSLL